MMATTVAVVEVVVEVEVVVVFFVVLVLFVVVVLRGAEVVAIAGLVVVVAISFAVVVVTGLVVVATGLAVVATGAEVVAGVTVVAALDVVVTSLVVAMTIDPGEVEVVGLSVDVEVLAAATTAKGTVGKGEVFTGAVVVVGIVDVVNVVLEVVDVVVLEVVDVVVLDAVVLEAVVLGVVVLDVVRVEGGFADVDRAFSLAPRELAPATASSAAGGTVGTAPSADGVRAGTVGIGLFAATVSVVAFPDAVARRATCSIDTSATETERTPHRWLTCARSCARSSLVCTFPLRRASRPSTRICTPRVFVLTCRSISALRWRCTPGIPKRPAMPTMAARPRAPNKPGTIASRSVLASNTAASPDDRDEDCEVGTGDRNDLDSFDSLNRSAIDEVARVSLPLAWAEP
jgi:hypothetical protein